jgi:hypothetical protein
VVRKRPTYVNFDGSALEDATRAHFPRI